MARYTLSARGMVLKMMMSAPQVFEPEDQRWGYVLAGPPPARLTPGRQRVLEAAANGLVWAKGALAETAGVSGSVIDGLAEAGTLQRMALPRSRLPAPKADFAPPELSEAQSYAAHALRETVKAGGFSVSLLDGVTGSGKTEVYFEAVAEALDQGRQALLLLPEIALTSQFLARFEARFGCRPAEWHSGVTPSQRARLWRAVAEGEARAVLGARSALFLPFSDLGLIVVDEEHDNSYKQDDNVNYQARDMAVVRASLGGVPVVLSSATPSIESLVNALTGRYRHIRLESRFHATALPDLSAIDLRRAPPERGRWLSPPLIQAVIETLAKGPAGAVVPQPPGLRAAHPVPPLRTPFRMPAMHRQPRGASLQAEADLPSLRLHPARAQGLPQMQRRGNADALRTGRRAGGRRGGRALPGHADGHSVERPSADHHRPARGDRQASPRGRPGSSSAPRSWPRAITSPIWPWWAWWTATSASPRAIRARPSARSSFSTR